MEKLIVQDKVFSHEKIKFSHKKPIKISYNNIISPIFTIKAGLYSISTNKSYVSLTLNNLDSNVKLFLSSLDQKIPDIAYENRKEWFASDLHDADYESFIENYRKNISDYGFSIYLGPIEKSTDLPVSCFINDGINKTKKLNNSFQELAWGNHNGYIIILAQISNLWIKEESYGLSWKVLQILYRKKPCLPNGCQVFNYNDEHLTEKISNHTWIIPSDNINDNDSIKSDLSSNNSITNDNDIDNDNNNDNNDNDNDDNNNTKNNSDINCSKNSDDNNTNITGIIGYNSLLETDD